MYRLEISSTAHHQIRHLPPKNQERVNTAISKLTDNPRPSGVEKLKVIDGYRIRVGDLRILYDIDDSMQTVVIYRVLPRENVYR